MKVIKMNKDWIIILLVLLVYSIGFFTYYPTIPTISDETYYLLQGKIFSEGKITTAIVDPYTNEAYEKLGGHYPIGTSVLLAPLFYIGGIKGAYLFPLFCLILVVLVTAKWLSESGYSPLFSLFIISYPPTMVFGRIPTVSYTHLTLPTICSV